jgi:hypothetical protein
MLMAQSAVKRCVPLALVLFVMSFPPVWGVCTLFLTLEWYFNSKTVVKEIGFAK